MELDLSFEVVNQKDVTMAAGSAGCSNAPRSTCCTRVCTRVNDESSSVEAWDLYLEVNAGVLQY
ncbi:hypothetical protein [Moraxella osloensis]|uniref:Uncharacterized protein n=1 Tax=Faucicola osloensis TaxID=34062 RepID=A0A2D2LXZ2_FAUOS|nr:hypothetical protein [Moraxella osloensis]ATR79830.1 hypothetical protein NP7_10725 [Moraxella osloensis]